MFVMLEDFDERRGPDLTADAIAAGAAEALRRRGRARRRVGVFGAPPIDGLGTAGGFKIIVEDRGNLGLRRPADGSATRSSTRGNRTPGLAGPVHQLPGQHALALPGHRPRPSAWRWACRSATSSTRLQVYLGSLLRQRLQRVRPHLAGQRPGRPAVPRPTSSDIRQLQVRNNQGQMVPLGTLLRRARHQRPGDGDALQHVLGRGHHRQRRRRAPAPARPSRSWRTIADQELPQSMALRVDRAGLPAAAGGQHGDVRLRAGGGVRVPGAGGAVRELVAAAGGHPGRADVPALLASPACDLARHGHQHLHADRLRGAGRPGEQERDPDRRVRQAARRSGRAALRGDAGGRAGCGCGRS